MMQALRLNPGDDLRGALEALSRTGFVVAGIGSLAPPGSLSRAFDAATGFAELVILNP